MRVVIAAQEEESAPELGGMEDNRLGRAGLQEQKAQTGRVEGAYMQSAFFALDVLS